MPPRKKSEPFYESTKEESNPLGVSVAPSEAKNVIFDTDLPNANIEVVKAAPPMERIEFRNEQDPGSPKEFHFCHRKHNIPPTHYVLYHGEEYDLPVEVIENLESRSLPMYEEVKDKHGNVTHIPKGSRFLYSCKPIRKRNK